MTIDRLKFHIAAVYDSVDFFHLCHEQRKMLLFLSADDTQSTSGLVMVILADE